MTGVQTCALPIWLSAKGLLDMDVFLACDEKKGRTRRAAYFGECQCGKAALMQPTADGARWKLSIDFS